MVVFLGKGVCGGHVTLLFTVNDEAEDSVEQGSIGAGLCVEDGVEAIAYGKQGEFGLKVSFEGEEGDLELYNSVLELLVKEIPEAEEIAWENARLSRILRYTDYDFNESKPILWSPTTANN